MFSNITLESEINVYRRLLDSETNRLSQQPPELILPVEPAPPSFGSELGKVFNKKIKKGPIAISTSCILSFRFDALDTIRPLITVFSLLLQRTVHPMVNALHWKMPPPTRTSMCPTGLWSDVWKVHRKLPTLFPMGYQSNTAANWRSSLEVPKMPIIDHHCKWWTTSSTRGAWERNAKRNCSMNKVKRRRRIRKRSSLARIHRVLFLSKSSFLLSLSLSCEWSEDTGVEQRWFEWMSHRHITRLFFSDSAWPECKWYTIRGRHSFSILFCYLFSVLMTGQAFGFYCFHFHWHVGIRSFAWQPRVLNERTHSQCPLFFSRSRNDLIKEQLDWRRPMDHWKPHDEFENISFSLSLSLSFFPFSLYLFDNICREDSNFLSFFVNKDEIVFLSNDNHPNEYSTKIPASIDRFFSFSFIFKHFVVNDNDLLSYFNCVSKVAE